MTLSKVAIEVRRIPCIPSLLVASCRVSQRQGFAPSLRDSHGRRNYWKTQRKSPVKGRGFYTERDSLEGCFHRKRNERLMKMGGWV